MVRKKRPGCSPPPTSHDPPSMQERARGRRGPAPFDALLGARRASRRFAMQSPLQCANILSPLKKKSEFGSPCYPRYTVRPSSRGKSLSGSSWFSTHYCGGSVLDLCAAFRGPQLLRGPAHICVFLTCCCVAVVRSWRRRSLSRLRSSEISMIPGGGQRAGGGTESEVARLNSWLIQFTEAGRWWILLFWWVHYWWCARI